MKRFLKRLSCAACVLSMLAVMFSFLATPALADATRVVTLGQDLSDEQEAFIINYFGVDLSTARVIYVNNQQEREYLGSWIPLEQIGNITISSAYVQPTNSGGIQVRTANLTYVTGNMIASVLSTAGITNCNVVAAAPFAVSGTGALTGVMIAYQEATGEALDNTKRDLAVQEFTVTQQASGSIGENEALQLVNAVKMEVIQSGVAADDTQQIEQIIDEVVSDMDQSLAISGNGNQIDSLTMDESVNVDNSTYYDYSVTSISNSLSAEDRQMLIDLAARIAEQDYDTTAIMETLERVNDNLADKTSIEINVSNGNTIDNSNNNTNSSNNDNNSSSDTSVSVDDADSIFNDMNIEALPDNVVQSATDDEGKEELEEMEEQKRAAQVVQAVPADSAFPEMQEDFYVYDPMEGTTPQEPVQPQETDFTDTMTGDAQQQAEQAQQAGQAEQTEQSYQMPEYTETIVPEPQQPEQPQDYTTDTDNTDNTEDTTPEVPQEPQETDSSAATDEWQVAKVPEGQTLRSDVQEVWDKMESTTFEGVVLTPAVYLGSQVVAGLNYEIICTGTPQDAQDGEDTLYMVIMYETLDGTASITNMTKIDLDELFEEEADEPATGELLAGGWQFSKSAEAASAMEQGAATASSALIGAYPDKNLTPVMHLATKHDDTTVYAFLCYEIPEGEESGFYEVAFVTGDEFGNATSFKLVPLDLADYNS